MPASLECSRESVTMPSLGAAGIWGQFTERLDGVYLVEPKVQPAQLD
jgi:hypothetical protein